MKPDIEPVFYHPTLVHKNDSKPFTTPKTTMKENQDGFTCDLQNCGRDVDRPASEMNDTDGFRNTPELKYPTAMDDLSKADENEVGDSVTPYTIPSSVVELLENRTEVYMDKNVMECEEPKLIICYKESAYHVVRDICIDEGVPSEDKLLIKNAKDGHKGNFIIQPSNGDKNVCIDDENIKLSNGDKIGDITKERVRIALIEKPKDEHKSNCIFPPTNEDKNFDLDEGVPPSEAKILIENGKDEQKGHSIFKPCNGDKIDDSTKQRVDIDLLIPDVLSLHGDANGEYGTQEKVGIESEPSSENNFDNECGFLESIQKVEANFIATDDKVDYLLREEVTQLSNQPPSEELISESPALAPSTESNNCISANDLCTITFDFNSTEPSNFDHRRPVESQNVINHHDVISDTSSISSQVHHFHGESSFSAEDTVSGLITFSGPIAFSGSLSLRSDSSTTSTRSFAFPVLQPEWNSSPVRMAKADQRQFRKHRGWRQSLLCCRF